MITKEHLQSLVGQLQVKQQQCADQHQEAGNRYWQSVGALALVQEMLTQVERQSERPVTPVSKVKESGKKVKARS